MSDKRGHALTTGGTDGPTLGQIYAKVEEVGIATESIRIEFQNATVALRSDVLADLDKASDGLTKQIEKLGDRQSADLVKVRTDIMDRVDRLQNGLTDMRAGMHESLTSIREDIGVNMGAADAAHRANDNTRELVRLQADQLSLMWRKITALEKRLREITGDP